MGDIWTIKAALDWTVGYLERKGDENPRLSAEWLLSEACDMSRIQLYVSFDRPLSLEERDILRGYVTRRGKGEPLQYITGYAAFRHIQVKVRPGVLIPRPKPRCSSARRFRFCPRRTGALRLTAPSTLGKGMRSSRPRPRRLRLRRTARTTRRRH